MQGQGPTTEWKERRIQAILHVSQSLAKKQPHYTYWHADLNSGSGFNENANCIGSPLAFLGAAQQAGRQNFRAVFVDHDERLIEALMKTPIGQDKRCACFNCDNGEILPVLSEMICAQERRPHYAFGSLIVDPNGYFGDEVPLNQLVTFCSEFPRMDMVLNLNVRTYQLMRPHIAKGIGKWNGKVCPALSDLPKLLSRPHWLVCKVIGQRSRFVLLVGRSYKAGDHAAIGLYHMDGERGQQIIMELDGTDDTPESANLF